MISACLLSCLPVNCRSENPCTHDVWWQRETNSSGSESLHELAWVRRFLHSLALFFFAQAVMIMKKDLSWSIVLIVLVWRMSFFYCAPYQCITFELVELCMYWCVELPCTTTHSSCTLPVWWVCKKAKVGVDLLEMNEAKFAQSLLVRPFFSFLLPFLNIATCAWYRCLEYSIKVVMMEVVPEA